MTENTLTHEDLALLKAHFAPAQHEFLRGMAYITEAAVTDRLEEVDPAWSLDIQRIDVRGSQCTVAVRMTVKGVARDGVGMAGITVGKSGSEVNEAEKAAATDALKRAARLFGVGRYLLTLPDSVRDMPSLTAWLNGGKPIVTTQSNAFEPPQQQGKKKPQATWATPENVAKLPELVGKQINDPTITKVEVARLAGIERFEDYAAWSAKFASGKEAVAFMVAEFNAPAQPQGGG